MFSNFVLPKFKQENLKWNAKLWLNYTAYLNLMMYTFYEQNVFNFKNIYFAGYILIEKYILLFHQKYDAHKHHTFGLMFLN